MKLHGIDLCFMEIDGYTLFVPVSYRDATQEEIQANTGGCGPGKLGDWFVPDALLGESIFRACQIHDWVYYKEVKNKEQKSVADLLLLWNATVIINDLELLDRVRLRLVMDYYLAVSFHGDSAAGL